MVYKQAMRSWHTSSNRECFTSVSNKFNLPSEVNVVTLQPCAGHSDKFVRYRTFLQGLNLLLANNQVCQLQIASPSVPANFYSHPALLYSCARRLQVSPVPGVAEADLARPSAGLSAPATQQRIKVLLPFMVKSKPQSKWKTCLSTCLRVGLLMV